MIDLRHPPAVLSARLPRASIEVAVALTLAHEAKPAKRVIGTDLAGAFDGAFNGEFHGEFDGEFGGGISPAGCPRLLVRLIVSLLHPADHAAVAVLSQQVGTRKLARRTSAR